MQGVWRVDGEGISDEYSDDSTWDGSGDTVAMENPRRGVRATDFQNDLPVEGRPAELPGGGMPGPSDNEDGNAGALPAPACPQHRGHSGGGKPPPPTVRPMRHYVPLTGPERQALFHNPVCQGSGAEDAASRRGRDKGELRAGL